MTGIIEPTHDLRAADTGRKVSRDFNKPWTDTCSTLKLPAESIEPLLVYMRSG